MQIKHYFAPETIQEALELLWEYQNRAIIVNGGTDIVEQIANGHKTADAIIYIQNIQALKKIEYINNMLAVGACATYINIEKSALCAPFHALQDAVIQLGSAPIRVLGTLAGNIVTAAPAADGNVAMLALNAQVQLVSKEGERLVPLSEFFLASRKTIIKPYELIQNILLPQSNSSSSKESQVTCSGFYKLAKRKAQDIAQVSSAVCLVIKENQCVEASVAIGAIAGTTVKAKSYEHILCNNSLDQALEMIKARVPDEASLRNPKNRAYKEAVIGITVERAIKIAIRRTFLCLSKYSA